MNIPTTTSGHVTRKQVLDALADLNPATLPTSPFADCPPCLLRGVEEMGLRQQTWAAFHLVADIVAFGEPAWVPWSGEGLHMPLMGDDSGFELVIEPVMEDDDELYQPLALNWGGKQAEVEAILRKHGLPYMAPASRGVAFQIVPYSAN